MTFFFFEKCHRASISANSRCLQNFLGYDLLPTALVTKVRTNDEFVRISQFLRIPAFVDIRRGHSILRSSYEVRTAAAQFARST